MTRSFSTQKIWGKSASIRGNRKCKGPEVTVPITERPALLVLSEQRGALKSHLLPYNKLLGFDSRLGPGFLPSLSPFSTIGMG